MRKHPLYLEVFFSRKKQTAGQFYFIAKKAVFGRTF